MNETEIDGIPIAWVEPEAAPAGAALWLHSLGGSTEQSGPMLRRLAERGLIAVTFDAPDHGRRSSGDSWAHARRVLAAFRRLMWPQLGRTTLECLRVLDWIDDTFPDAPELRVAGGLSMGGDVAVALAGIDARISRTASIVSTPDWTRPGMRALNEDQVLDQGAADAYAQWFYDRLDPFTHLDNYGRELAISFQCGQDDNHVPADGALRFRDALAERFGTAGPTVQVDVHPGVSHVDGVDPLYVEALEWLQPRR